jgi:ABC-type polysaccharide/polyol phosphate transport system ATPase subunit
MNMPIESNDRSLSRNSKSTDENSASIELDDVAVRYVLPTQEVSGIKEFAIRLLQGKVSTRSIWALKELNLHVERGNMLGVVGKNGAGKSTLLKVTARVLRPTLGKVVVRGTTAPLLSLGAGFHPELKGRENIYLYGALLGMTRAEIDDAYDEIVAFSGLADFIDIPLRMYSSGMWARLGFSVVTCRRPDILLIDEVLAVGDPSFQKKCFQRLESFRVVGTTIVIVTHALKIVENMCDRAILLDKGKIVARGKPDSVLSVYEELRSVDIEV